VNETSKAGYLVQVCNGDPGVMWKGKIADMASDQYQFREGSKNKFQALNCQEFRLYVEDVLKIRNTTHSVIYTTSCTKSLTEEPVTELLVPQNPAHKISVTCCISDCYLKEGESFYGWPCNTAP
jgi:hypothetical protein